MVLSGLALSLTRTAVSIFHKCPSDAEFQQIVKHIANEDGVQIFRALWTAQALTLTKGHEERIGPLMGIATSAKRYGLGEPLIAHSDDPVKDKGLLCAVFPNLGQDLTPMAAAHGLNLPTELTVMMDSPQLVQNAFTSLIGPLDIDKSAHIYCSTCTSEHNLHYSYSPIPKITSITFALSDFKTGLLIGSAIQADLTRLKKQFNQLEDQTFNIVDLKQYAIQRGLIPRNGSDPSLRKSEDWGKTNIPSELIKYAALDVFASRLVFEKISETAPLDCVQYDTAPGTPIALLARAGGEIAAYGRISGIQTPSFAGVRVKTPKNTRVLVDIESILIASAAAILHIPPSSGQRTRTKAGALTLSQLRSQCASPTFQLVSPVTLLQFDRRSQHAPENIATSSSSEPPPPQLSAQAMTTVNHCNWCSDHAYCQLQWNKMWTSVSGVLGALIKDELAGSVVLDQLEGYPVDGMNLECQRRTCDGLKDTVDKKSILKREEDIIDAAARELMKVNGIA
ncbi:hypothetical protein B0H14DRAFT_3604128 [Mycena olivaceomarginata]|nr:hypothetical protein B0H14DRAFT_3604128 [Mycena olivaceomarginata]